MEVFLHTYILHRNLRSFITNTHRFKQIAKPCKHMFVVFPAIKFICMKSSCSRFLYNNNVKKRYLPINQEDLLILLNLRSCESCCLTILVRCSYYKKKRFYKHAPNQSKDTTSSMLKINQDGTFFNIYLSTLSWIFVNWCLNIQENCEGWISSTITGLCPNNALNV